MAPTEADLSNWRESPYNRWAFRNVPAIIAGDRIENDPDRVAPLPLATKTLGASFLRTLPLKASATDALVVLADGEIAFEYYANGNDEHSSHILMSATKALTGLIAEMLAREGLLDLEATVSRYVPEVARSGFGSATLRDLLDMRCGVILTAEQEADYNIATGWNRPQPGMPPGDLHDFFSRLPPREVTHGVPFSYISANTDLLGWAIERASGTSMPVLLAKMLWRPLGAQSAGYLTHDPAGHPRTSGGFCSTARDFARIGALIASDGMREAKNIVPKPLIDDLHQGGDTDAWARGQWGKSFEPLSKSMSYRSGWYASHDRNWLFAMGIHGQNLFIDREKKVVVAKFSSWSQATDYVALPLNHYAAGLFRKAVK